MRSHSCLGLDRVGARENMNDTLIRALPHEIAVGCIHLFKLALGYCQLGDWLTLLFENVFNCNALIGKDLERWKKKSNVVSKS